MKIIIDLQGAQTESRYRGIGQYTNYFLKAFIKNSNTHEIHIVLNGSFTEATLLIKKDLSILLPYENIHIFFPTNFTHFNSLEDKRRTAAAFLRELFIANLHPDFILICSHFEGYIDNAISTVKMYNSSFPTAVIVYDLIPYVFSEIFFKDQVYKEYYLSQLKQLESADLLFSISDYTREDYIRYLNTPSDKIINIGTAVNETVFNYNENSLSITEFKSRLKIQKDYIICVGTTQPHKNLKRFLEGFSLLPQNIKENYQIVFPGMGFNETNDKNQIYNWIQKLDISNKNIIFPGYLEPHTLASLYRHSILTIVPSYYEGFGLPALEAMSCGCAVIGSNNSSLTEVIGIEEALFDPFSSKQISNTLLEALTNKDFYHKLKTHALLQAQKLHGIKQRFARLRQLKKYINLKKH